jgi:hypothetical protein
VPAGGVVGVGLEAEGATIFGRVAPQVGQWVVEVAAGVVGERSARALRTARWRLNASPSSPTATRMGLKRTLGAPRSTTRTASTCVFASARGGRTGTRASWGDLAPRGGMRKETAAESQQCRPHGTGVGSPPVSSVGVAAGDSKDVADDLPGHARIAGVVDSRLQCGIACWIGVPSSKRRRRGWSHDVGDPLDAARCGLVLLSHGHHRSRCEAEPRPSGPPHRRLTARTEPDPMCVLYRRERWPYPTPKGEE